MPASADPPRVSVLMPCLNAAETVARAVASVQAQTCADWELIVADDGSEDDSAAVVATLAQADPRVILLPFPKGTPRGAARARNRALAAARGRYIAFLDADDLWLPDKLTHQLDLMERTGALFACASYLVRKEGRPDTLRHPPAEIDRARLLRHNAIGCLTAIYDAKRLGKHPMPDIPLRHDYALWLHLLTLTDRAVSVAEPLAIHHRHSGSLSASGWRATVGTWRMFRDTLGMGPLPAAARVASHNLHRLLAG